MCALSYWSKTHCYTLTQNTRTRLVQITSRDVHKYALLPARSGNIEVVKWFLLKCFVLVLRYNKTNSNWRRRLLLKIVCPGQHFFRTWGKKNSMITSTPVIICITFLLHVLLKIITPFYDLFIFFLTALFSYVAVIESTESLRVH